MVLDMQMLDMQMQVLDMQVRAMPSMHRCQCKIAASFSGKSAMSARHCPKLLVKLMDGMPGLAVHRMGEVQQALTFLWGT